MRKFTLFLMSLFLAVGAMAQITANTATYTIKSVNRGYIYYDYPTQSLFSSSFQSIVNTAPSGELNEQFAFLRTDNTADGEYYMYCVAAEKFVTYSGSGVALDLTESPSCTWSLDADGSYWLIKVPGTQKTYINITNWEAVNGCKVTSTDPDDGNKMTLEEVANNLDLSEAIAKIETFEAPPAREDYVHNTGNINRGDRGLTSFTITDGENSLTVNSIQTSAQAPVYVDKSAQKLTTKQGATLKFTDFNYTGSWMHAYAYIDYNNDFEFNLTNNNNGEGDGEIVSYNYYDGNDITGTPANQGSAIGNTYGESKAMPAFTLPRALPAGEYRVRIKIDWNNLDADYGAGDIAANGGCQCDFTIVVEEAVGNEIAKNALNNAVDEALALFDAVKIGTSVGSYGSSIDGYEAEFNDIMTFKNSITEETPSDEIDAKTARVREIIASFSLNMPKAGDYIRIKSIEGWNDDARYLGAQNSTANTSRAEFVAEAGANTIFYFDGENLISYASGNYLVNNSSFAGYNGVQANGTKIEFRTSNNTSNRHAYNISFKGNDNATRWLYTNTNNFTDAGGSCGTEGGYNFNLEPVTELPVTVTAAGYATFFAPVAVTVPSGVTAHTVTINGEWATLSEALTIVPANTGVVLAGEGSHNLEITTTENTATSALRGSAATTYYTAPGTYYALGLVDGEVGFYKDKFNNNRFQNNSHKAYLYVAEGNNAAQYSFRFGEGTTGIEEVKGESGEVKGIYDLTGRRVEAITAPGIYIVGGKKVLVK